MVIREFRVVREVQKGKSKDVRCSFYFQFCNKSVGFDNVQGCYFEDFIGVVYFMFFENFRCDWDGGVNLVNLREV